MSDAKIFFGDCVTVMRRAVRRGTANLVIADAPYNQGELYANYNDRRPWDEFLAWTKSWMAAIDGVLHCHGSVWLVIPDEWVAEADLYCRNELRWCRRNWVIWTFSFGNAAQNRFTRSHVHLLYFVKTKSKFTFNADAVRVPSARQAVYNDNRALSKGKLPDDTWALLKPQVEGLLTPADDTWSVSRICGSFKERQKHSPNQIPLPITDRIVQATSNPGDTVLDCFLGAGGAGVSALAAGRNFVGIDISETCCRASAARIRRETKIVVPIVRLKPADPAA